MARHGTLRCTAWSVLRCAMHPDRAASCRAAAAMRGCSAAPAIPAAFQMPAHFCLCLRVTTAVPLLATGPWWLWPACRAHTHRGSRLPTAQHAAQARRPSPAAPALPCLAVAAVLNVLLPVQEPVGDLVGAGVGHDGHDALQLLGRQLAGAARGHTRGEGRRGRDGLVSCSIKHAHPHSYKSTWRTAGVRRLAPADTTAHGPGAGLTSSAAPCQLHASGCRHRLPDS